MLIGQERAEATLARALQQGRVSHAYLFTGPEAVGKHTAALLFAQALNCVGRGDGGTGRRGDGATGRRADGVILPLNSSDLPVSPSPRLPVPPSSLAPCGACESCRRIAAGTHPDVHVIVPGSKSGQNISVEQMREVRQDVARRPIMGRRKLYLVPNAEAMNEEAANTLLKTLEEPPEYVTLILMAASPTRVLPTVLSRCQAVPFGLVAANILREGLQARGIDAETAAALAFSAAGRPGLALRWSRDPEVLARRRQVLDLLEETAQFRRQAGQKPGEAIAALRLAERARSLAGSEESEAEEKRPTGGAKSGSAARGAGSGGRAAGTRMKGEAPATAETRAPEAAPADGEPAGRAARSAYLRLLELTRGYYRDLLLLAQGAPESMLWNADRLSGLREAAGRYSPAELLSALSAVDRCQQFLERNVAPQLALEVLFLDLLQPSLPQPEPRWRVVMGESHDR